MCIVGWLALPVWVAGADCVGWLLGFALEQPFASECLSVLLVLLVLQYFPPPPLLDGFVWCLHSPHHIIITVVIVVAIIVTIVIIWRYIWFYVSITLFFRTFELF